MHACESKTPLTTLGKDVNLETLLVDKKLNTHIYGPQASSDLIRAEVRGSSYEKRRTSQSLLMSSRLRSQYVSGQKLSRFLTDVNNRAGKLGGS